MVGTTSGIAALIGAVLYIRYRIKDYIASYCETPDCDCGQHCEWKKGECSPSSPDDNRALIRASPVADNRDQLKPVCKSGTNLGPIRVH
jgi:hypothetical protein